MYVCVSIVCFDHGSDSRDKISNTTMIAMQADQSKLSPPTQRLSHTHTHRGREEERQVHSLIGFSIPNYLSLTQQTDTVRCS